MCAQLIPLLAAPLFVALVALALFVGGVLMAAWCANRFGGDSND